MNIYTNPENPGDVMRVLDKRDIIAIISSMMFEMTFGNAWVSGDILYDDTTLFLRAALDNEIVSDTDTPNDFGGIAGITPGGYVNRLDAIPQWRVVLGRILVNMYKQRKMLEQGDDEATPRFAFFYSSLEDTSPREAPTNPAIVEMNTRLFNIARKMLSDEAIAFILYIEVGTDIVPYSYVVIRGKNIDFYNIPVVMGVGSHPGKDDVVLELKISPEAMVPANTKDRDQVMVAHHEIAVVRASDEDDAESSEEEDIGDEMIVSDSAKFIFILQEDGCIGLYSSYPAGR